MKLPLLKRRTISLVAVITLLLLLFIYVIWRTGPMAQVPVTVTTVEERSIAPELFGIGTVQARYTYKIGPTSPGRLKWLNIDVGDKVSAGQILGEIDAVDLNDKIQAQRAAIRHAEAVKHQTQVAQSFTQEQVQRYEALKHTHNASEEMLAIKQQDFLQASSALDAAKENVVRLQAELKALQSQSDNLQLQAPVAGLVVARHIEPGTTVLAGQAVVEIIDPESLWIHTRFDQISANGLQAGLPVHIVLRSQQDRALLGHVLRIEPLADAVTEETLVKVVFNSQVTPLPPLGELAEVTVQLASLPEVASIPSAAIRILKGQRGVWKVVDGRPVFTEVVLGRSDLDGYVQVLDGLTVGETVVLYSEKALTAKSRLGINQPIKGLVK